MYDFLCGLFGGDAPTSVCEDVKVSAWSQVNPATGLLVDENGYDSAGNPYGLDGSDPNNAWDGKIGGSFDDDLGCGLGSAFDDSGIECDCGMGMDMGSTFDSGIGCDASSAFDSPSSFDSFGSGGIIGGGYSEW